MRILQVITDTDRRGAQVFATDLGVALERRGHVVRTVALIRGQQQPALPVDVLGPRYRHPRTLHRLRREMAAADVTIAHGSATGLACAIAGLGCGRPFVYRQISDTRFWAGTRSRRARVSRYLRRAHMIVALSAGAKADLVEHLGLPEAMITVVPNGVPVGPFRPVSIEEREAARAALGLPCDGVVALFIGALVPEKGADVAIAAVAGLRGVTLALAGGGPERAALEDQARESAQGNVRFLGVLDDTGPAYAAADLVLLPSRGGDSMPATLIEAGFCGLPSVATSVGSITDIVLDGETGLIVPAGDEAELRRAIEHLVLDVLMRGRLGSAARSHCVAAFEIDVVAHGWTDVLGAVAEATR